MDAPYHIGFVLVPEFPLYALVPAIEALRLANQNSGTKLFDWSFASASGGRIAAGNGMAIDATVPVGPHLAPSFAIVCGGNDPTQYLDKRLLDWLRRRSAFGTRLGSLDTGAFALAAAGVLDGHRATLHWEAIPAFQDMFPHLSVVEQLFVIDRERWTCAGGTAALDMILALIEGDHGKPLATIVTDGFIHEQRSAASPQRDTRAVRVQKQSGWHGVVRLMSENMSYPLTIDELCERAGTTRRTLERLFQRKFGVPPAEHYLHLRLNMARDRLFYTEDPISHIAEAAGFINPAHFSRTFKKRYGLTPSEFRRRTSASERHRFHPTGATLISG